MAFLYPPPYGGYGVPPPAPVYLPPPAPAPAQHVPDKGQVAIIALLCVQVLIMLSTHLCQLIRR